MRGDCPQLEAQVVRSHSDWVPPGQEEACAQQ
jgi:hypothetical protein